MKKLKPTSLEEDFTHNCELDFEEASSFLSHLGKSAEMQLFTALDDNRTNASRSTFGTFDSKKAQLDSFSRQGLGIFFCINKTDGKGRKKTNIIATADLLVADLDDTPIDHIRRLALEPHAIVQTSPGRFQVWWRVNDLPLDYFSSMMQRLATALGSDMSVCDLPHVFRLPGSWHRKMSKIDKKIQPFKVSWQKGSATEPYSVSDFELELEKIELLLPKSTPIFHVQKPNSVQGTEFDVSNLVSLIPNDERFESRKAWIRMLHAIAGASGYSEWGRDLWIKWCGETYLTKDRIQKVQDIVEVERVWDKLDRSQVKSSMATLRRIAEEVNPKALKNLWNKMLADSPLPTITTLSSGSLDNMPLLNLENIFPPRAGQIITADHDFFTRPVLMPLSVTEWVARGQRTLIAGRGGIGKTSYVLALIAAILWEEPKLIGEKKIKRCGDVRLYGAEDSLSTLQARLQALRRHWQLDPCARKHQLIIDRRPLVIAEKSKRGTGYTLQAKSVAEICADGRTALVYFDTWTKLSAGLDENNAGDMRFLAEYLDQLSETANVAVLTVTHLRKSSSKAPDVSEVRGSSDIVNAARCVLQVGTPSLTESNTRNFRDPKDFFKVEVTKANDAPHGHPRFFERVLVNVPAIEPEDTARVMLTSRPTIVAVPDLTPASGTSDHEVLKVLEQAATQGKTYRVNSRGVGESAAKALKACLGLEMKDATLILRRLCQVGKLEIVSEKRKNGAITAVYRVVGTSKQ